MYLRRIFAVSAVCGLALLSACGDDGPHGYDDGPAATFTASSSGCTVLTDGFSYEAGTFSLRFVNEHDADVTVELLTSDDEVVAVAEDVAPDDTVDLEADLEAGEHAVRCSDGTLTWDNSGEGETPDGVIRSSPGYTVD